MGQNNAEEQVISNIIELINKDIEDGDLYYLLKFFRTKALKLSETSLKKSVFNQWKGEGLTKKMETDYYSWNRFSLVDLVLLDVLKVLWFNSVENAVISKVIDRLLEKVNINQFDSFINYWKVWEQIGEQEGFDAIEKIKSLAPKIDIETYLNEQSRDKLTPTYTISWIEAFMLGVLRTDRPYFIAVYPDGNYRMVYTDIYTDEFQANYMNDILKETFVLVSINGIVNNLISAKANIDSGAANAATSNTLLNKLMNLGLDSRLISKVVNYRSEKGIEIISHDVKDKLSLLANKYESHDMIIKVRGKKILSIQSFLFKKNK
jgi:hypothetical protein